MPPLLTLGGVGKAYGAGRLVLGPLDLVIGEREFLAIVGPSGCGKSTLLRLMAGLSEPSIGTVDRAVVSGSAVGFVFQDPTLLPWATVFDNVWLPLHLAGIGRGEARQRVEAALVLVDLREVADFYPAQLSGGMRMRASIARALVTRPRLLLLDEPFAALDEITRFRLNGDLLRLWRDETLTAVFVTHSVFDAVFLATRVVVMSKMPGRILADFAIDLPQPRRPALRTEPIFGTACRAVSAVLAQDAAA